jgi:cephalosporin hydroxylase
MIAIDTTPVPFDDVREAVRLQQKAERPTIDAFHRLSYHGFTWSMTTWMGVPCLKHPCDLFSLHDVLTQVKPALIVETGTAYGGSALFMAHVLDAIGGPGSIVSIDLEPFPKVPQHPRITYRQGSSLDPEIVAYVQGRAQRAESVLVLLDSDHHADHVAAELATYAPLVTPGSYAIVEDTNVNGHPVLPEFGPGPGEAVAAFLANHPEFEADPLRERYLVTMHPGGWLRRVA